ncbi:MAG: hypothetical protein K5866_02855 [Treponema sp.]|nr:hypothetical protein [Treponema sp.]
MCFFKKLFHKRNHLISDQDFDEKYKIVLIRGFNDRTPFIYEINDCSYTSILFEFPEDYSMQDIKVYKFSDGVRELCIKQQLSLLFDKDYTYNRDDFINYLRNSGCSDIVVDGFIDCTASDINNSYMPKNRVLKVYDMNGKFIGLKKIDNFSPRKI